MTDSSLKGQERTKERKVRRKLKFSKMEGTGNDFVVMDNRSGMVKDRENLAKKICLRKKGVGADGLLLLEKSDRADFRMRIFNPDGSEPGMCGNGARCIARFAYLEGIIDKECSFETLSGLVSAHIDEENVKIKMKDPSFLNLKLELSLKDDSCAGYHLDTGVPHFVLFVPEIERVALGKLGPEIRYHQCFQPAGTNVNFVEVKESFLEVRTYERGVEAETLSCGTGVTAAAIIASLVRSFSSPVEVRTKGGNLKVHFQRRDKTNFTQVFLEGEVRLIYEGRYSDNQSQ